MKPLVSILIPAYNAQNWVAETIKSALAQTWPNIEIVIVDDGSTDQTLSVVKGFESKQVIVSSQANQGAAATRNTAFSLCHGDYIQWLDADDLIAPDKIEQQMSALSRAKGKRTLLSSAYGSFFFRPSHAKFKPSPLWQDLSPADWLIGKMSHGCHMQTATWLVSREITEAAGPWNTQLLGDDDGEYFCRAIRASDEIIFERKAKVYYREVGTNRLSFVGRSKRKLEAQYLSNQFHINYLRGLEDSERTRAACVKYLQKYMFDFHPDRPDLVDQMRQQAVELGGELQYPKSSWKYWFIEKLFGWDASKGAQLTLPHYKTSLYRSWDKAMYWLERKKH